MKKYRNGIGGLPTRLRCQTVFAEQVQLTLLTIIRSGVCRSIFLCLQCEHSRGTIEERKVSLRIGPSVDQEFRPEIYPSRISENRGF